jgi:hypothetical protein
VSSSITESPRKYFRKHWPNITSSIVINDVFLRFIGFVITNAIPEGMPRIGFLNDGAAKNESMQFEVKLGRQYFGDSERHLRANTRCSFARLLLLGEYKGSASVLPTLMTAPRP